MLDVLLLRAECVSADMRFSIFMILLLTRHPTCRNHNNLHIHLHPSAAILLLHELSAFLALLHQLRAPHLPLCFLLLSRLATCLGNWPLFLSSYCFCYWFLLGEFDVGGSSLQFVSFEQLHTSICKEFFQVFTCLCRDFEVRCANILQFFFGVILGDGSLFGLVDLVTNDDYVDVFAAILLDVVQPHVKILEAVGVGHVIHQKDRVRVTQVAWDQASETLLASCVPQLQTH